MSSFLSMVAFALVVLPQGRAGASRDARAEIIRLGGTFEAAPTGAILKIDLHASRVTDEDLALLSGCPDVRSLDLRLTKVSDAALAHVDALHRLQFLNLFRTNVTDAGLASLARLEELDTLLVGGTGVTDRGLEALKPLSKLRKLSVFDTRVTDAGLVHLEGLPALEVVLVAQTPVSEEGKRSLRKANPKIRFEEASAIETELFRIEGEAFVAPSRNKALQALLSKKPVLTFFEACGVGDAAEVARRLQEDPSLATSWNSFGWTALHLAAFSGSAETARLLLDYSADPNRGRSSGTRRSRRRSFRVNSRRRSSSSSAGPIRTSGRRRASRRSRRRRSSAGAISSTSSSRTAPRRTPAPTTAGPR